MTISTKLIASTFALVLTATSAFAVDYTKLRKDTRVHNELYAASIAYLINDNCADISIRKLSLVGRVLSLRSYAKGLGYTGAEVDAYVNSGEEQDRFRAIAEPWLASKGAVKNDAASYCAVGKQEIAKKSLVGSMLKAR